MFESEERRIAEKIKSKKLALGIYIMLRNGHIIYIDDYRKMVDSGKINPQDAYVYITRARTTKMVSFHYPFLSWNSDLVNAFLSKLGFYYGYDVAPATGLKYAALAEMYSYGRTVFEKEYLTIELVNLDIVANNTTLPKIVLEVLDGKLVSGEKELTYGEYKKILGMYESQNLFTGYNVDKALNIIEEYYDRGNQLLAKEVTRIVMDYYRTFNPYTVCYDTKTWEEVDCWSIR